MSDPRPRRPVKDRHRLPVSPEFNYEAHRINHIKAPCQGPAVTNPTILFHTIDAPHRHARIRVRVRCDEMPKARDYHAQLEISKDGGNTVVLRRHRTVGAKRDDDPGNTVDLHLGVVNHKWRVRFRVRADERDCQGKWAPGGSLVAADAAVGWSIWYDPDDAEIPPAVTSLTLDVDQHRARVSWDLPVEADNPDIPDLRISHLWVELWRTALDTGTLIKRDKYHHGEQKMFRLSKPATDTFFARVYTVSHTGKKSAAVTTSATKNTPSTPAAPAVAFEKINKRWRAVVTASTVAAADNEIASYVLVLVHKTTQVLPTTGDKRQRGRVDGDATGDDLTEVFRNIPGNHFVYVRERARDTEGRVSAFSAWTDAGRPSTKTDHDHDPGEITKHAGATTPEGALRCDGTSYATAAHPDLFAAIGYTYGGSGANFNVPDLRRRGPRGVGSGQSVGQNEGDAEGSRNEEHGKHRRTHVHKHKHRHKHGGHPTSRVDTGAGTHTHAAGTLNFTSSAASSGPASGGAGTPTDLTRVAHTHSVNPGNMAGDTGTQGSSHDHGTISGGSFSKWNELGPTSSAGHVDSNTTADGPSDLYGDSLTGDGTNYDGTAVDSSGNAIDLSDDEDTSRGHRRHPFVRVHFIIWT